MAPPVKSGMRGRAEVALVRKHSRPGLRERARAAARIPASRSGYGRRGMPQAIEARTGYRIG